MASRVVVLALVLSISKVQSQSIGCMPNSASSSKGQPSCGCGKSQPQTIQYQPSNNNGVKALPQLQIVPSQSCNLQAIPLSQLLSQSEGSNMQRGQSGISLPVQSIQVTSVPQMPSSCAPCTQSQSCNSVPSVISAPVSTITIPPTTCTTIVDNSLCNTLANALQMLIANDFINCAINNNVVNQECIPIPCVETSMPSELTSFVKNLNANQLQQYQGSTCSNIPDDQNIDWEQLLGRLQCQCDQPKNSDWTLILNYLNSKTKEPESEYSCYSNSLNNKGKTASRTIQCQEQKVPSCNNDGIIDAIRAYVGGSGNSCGTNKIAEVIFPEEIPAQLVCNYGYMQTTVPVVNYKVQPCGDSYPNIIVGSQTC